MQKIEFECVSNRIHENVSLKANKAFRELISLSNLKYIKIYNIAFKHRSYENLVIFSSNVLNITVPASGKQGRRSVNPALYFHDFPDLWPR